MAVEGTQVTVFSMQEDLWMSSRADPMIRYNLSQKGVDEPAWDVSLCYWVKPVSLASFEVHVSLAESSINTDALAIYRREEKVSFFHNGKYQFMFPNFTTELGLHQWAHYCHIFSSGNYQGYVGGEVRADGHLDTPTVPLSLNSSLVLGQEQDIVGGGFDKTQILRGQLAQANIWNRSLSKEEVQLLASCNEVAYGNIFSSEMDDVELVDVTKHMIDSKSLCKKTDEYVIFPEMRNLAESMLMCHRVGYHIYAPETHDANIELHAISRRFSDPCHSNYHLWVGLTDEANEDVWRKISDNTTVKNLSFAFDQPNGKREENCIFMSLIDGLWSDTQCNRNWKSCVPCSKNVNRPLRLRGLCMAKESETMYEVLGYRADKPYFHGYYGMMIFRTDGGSWEMFDTETNETVAAVSLVHRDDYPMGRHEWTLNSSICSHPKGTTIELGLSPCYDTEFMCSNGDCINKTLRCNTRDDCSDLSDEYGCTLLHVPEGYRAERPPENQVVEQAIELVTKIEILRFVKISDVNRVVSLELTVDIRWEDPRLKYLNLKNIFEWNKLTNQEKEKVWKPKLEFPNVYDGNVRMLKEDVYLDKTGEAMEPDLNDVNMNIVYAGSSATLIQQQHYSGSFACTFNVFYYPFDTQRCSVLVQLSSLRQEVVSFVTEKASVVYLEDKQLPSYTVVNYRATATHRGSNATKYSVLMVEFELARRWTVIVMSVYLPTAMLMVIGYSTLFVKVSLLQVRLIVSLTTLLVLYTLFNNTSDALPPTAYIKMIDVWFFFCIFLLFFVIISHVVVEHLETRDHIIKVNPFTRAKITTPSSLPDRVLIILRLYVVPVSVVIFSAVYWSLFFNYK
ncbi:uncharacterized protein LOC121856959 [Homarus americanus]|uniref:uncharacterized protein LOC121856959 n=1 Tax=Homarus americanus TaxID=6706 RepID=UPI001C48ADBB|nr:uncharacterized protein LOC121856959 [Homarus americanus]